MTFSDCADTTVPIYWLGRPGDLVQIRMPQEDYDRTPDANVVRHDLIAGQAVDRSFFEQRTWQVAYDMLSYSSQLLVEQIRTRQRGLGPYVLIDPQTVNFLTSNQSSGTDAWLTTAGFSVTGTGETLGSSTTATPVRGSRTLSWNLPISVTGSGGGVMSLTTVYSSSGWATPPTQGWTFTGQIQGGGGDPIVTVTPRLAWLDINGNVLSNSSGTPIATASGTWTPFVVTGTAPANAVYVVPRFSVTANTVSSSVILYFDEMQLDMRIDSRGPRAWDPGQGQPRVSIMTTKQSVSRIGKTNNQYTFVELSTSS